MTTLVADIETDGLFHDMTKIHCIAMKTLAPAGTRAGGDVDLYHGAGLQEAVDRLCGADRIIFHNGLGFDLHAINRFYNAKISPMKVIDTLVLSRMDDPERPQHNLNFWGQKSGLAKIVHEDWSVYTPEMGERCKQDVLITEWTYRYLMANQPHSSESLRCEHWVAYIIALQQIHGFRLDVVKAQELEATLRQEQLDIKTSIQESFHPTWVVAGKGKSLFYPGVHDLPVETPKVGTLTGKSVTLKGAPYSKVVYQPLNVNSRHQIEARLRLLGWKPLRFTTTGQALLSSEVMEEVALQFPQAEGLSRYYRILKQLGQLSDGANGWLKLVVGDRVHGSVNTIGCQTHRMAHYAPNMGQVDKKDSRMREVWIPSDGKVMVGIDADAIEARLLAHYLHRFDEGAFAEAVDKGKKEDGSDIHTRNLKATRMWKRDKGTSVKNLFYGYLRFEATQGNLCVKTV